jgi:hypothetical protein
LVKLFDCEKRNKQRVDCEEKRFGHSRGLQIDKRKNCADQVQFYDKEFIFTYWTDMGVPAPTGCCC